MERDLIDQDPEFSAWLNYRTEIKKYNKFKEKEEVKKKDAEPQKPLEKLENSR